MTSRAPRQIASGGLSALRGVCLVAACLFVLPATAVAARSKPAPAISKEEKQLEVARGHLKKAKVAFSLGEYEKAAKEWTYAYKFRPEPELLFNIAQATRLAGNREKARTLYESYLREVPNATNRAEVEKYLAELAPPPAVEASDAPKKKRSRKKKTDPTDS